MAEIGWIKLHRKVLDCWIWQVKPYDKARAWVDLLLLTMHRDKKMVIDNKPVIIKRGSYFTSRGILADRWGWSIKKIDLYLKTLEEAEMVTTTRTRQGTMITIVNYEQYQIEGTTKDTTEDTTKSTTEMENTQNKNTKNDKDRNKSSKNVSQKKVFYPNDEKLNQAFLDFMDMRKKIKKPMTDRAVTLAMNKLKDLSTLPFSDSADNDIAIKILEQSTMNCWQSLYPLKEDKNNRNKLNEINWDNA